MVTFDATGRTMVTGGIDGSIAVWNVDPDRAEHQACALAGRALTRDEWRRYLGERAYDPACE